jgi:Spy/CpxP family protein refolding chaperone
MQHGPMMQRGGFHGGPSGHFRGGERGGMEMGGFHMGPDGAWWKNPRIAERLSLTADQTKRMDDIVEHSRLDLIDLRANLEKEQVRLGPIMDANPVNTAAASAQIDKVADARANLEKANAKMLLSIRGVLTPDQWTKLHERPTPSAQGAAPAGAPGAAGGPPAGGGRWRGGRPGGPGGNGMDDIAPPVDMQ